MATTAKKAAPKTGKALQSKAGAGPALAQRSKDTAKPAFGKSAPKKVTPTAEKQAKAASPKKAAAEKRPSVATRMMRKVKGVAAGVAGFAASVVTRDGAKAKAKASTK
ncbi:hypothetical protein QEZ47_14520 [Aminobacter anthyllidis]|uniref:hypothetical protein n=1 Tax=Aminobacter anthyllidis TaxID=1035067 RepID=UPI0024576EDF|nr:hypothetical protein [Aminobacter anthyllidis]MDH4986720.1 hypothetical protein [Aminobacter anthyllidis]